ncbi:MAG: penicillin-binding protein activator LpoB [Treponema sp.]|jgi:PBP1b-binding outer membrane lipoprotein LpoB|nr:penicillin-binding protein activator LpoB [Treponema sp.]
MQKHGVINFNIRIKYLLRVFILILIFILINSCSSTHKVDRIAADTRIDLTGRWNDTDVRMVCESLINDCLSSPSVLRFIEQYTSRNTGKLPTAIVGTFRNDSSERINTSIITINMESAIVNSGKLEFVAGGNTRHEIRNERQDQLVNAKEDTATTLGYETAAILILTGSVNSIVEQAGNTTVRAYFVSAQLTNIETNSRLWMGNNNEIKKVIRQRNARP